MADIKVGNQSSAKASESPESQTGLQQQNRSSEISRSRERDPLGGFWSPGEFFSTNPFALMRRMSEEMDRQFGQMFGQIAGGAAQGGWSPAIEVREHDGQLEVCAELPGIKPEDVKVELTNDALVIHGERKSEHEHRIGKAYRSERRYGEFYRAIPIPEGANTEQVHAQFRDGVLQVTMPVQEASRSRQIPINAGESAASRSTISGSKTQSAASGGSSSAAAAAGAGSGTSTKDS
jgi:HSP20 family protein